MKHDYSQIRDAMADHAVITTTQILDAAASYAEVYAAGLVARNRELEQALEACRGPSIVGNRYVDAIDEAFATRLKRDKN